MRARCLITLIKTAAPTKGVIADCGERRRQCLKHGALQMADMTAPVLAFTTILLLPNL